MTEATEQLSVGLLNRMRAAVLGANDGIVSTSSVVMGVAGATNDQAAVAVAGMAALVAGALSMGVGEYVSVSSQSDAELAFLKRKRRDPDKHEVNSPWQAAVSSLLAFTAGGLVPFLAVLLAPDDYRIEATIIAVIIALVFTGYFSAVAGKASKIRAVLRVVIGGGLAMIITYYVGVLFGAAIA